ncbi:hypothetical protein DM02DRAFT_554905, partial [Periconia macrospinosa]
MSPPPKAILFDIGGVCVISPFQAILDYERAHNIPIGYINSAIQKGPLETGAWQQIERGEVELNDAWFARFKAQLEDADAWAAFCVKNGLPDEKVPSIDAKALFWDMMRISRTPDPYMYPALLKLGSFSVPSSSPTATGKQVVSQFILGALSNTIRFPPSILDDKNVPFTSALLHPSSSSSSPPPNSPLPNFDPTNIATHFHTYLSSAHLGVRKPDLAAYELAVRELSRLSEARGTGVIEARDVVFLDDIGANLKGARAVGLRTIKVALGRTREAVRELEEMVGRSLLEE